jgi:phage-related protein
MSTVNYPNIIYGIGSTTQYNISSIKTEFGDGYQEVAPDGINYIKQMGTLEHPLIPANDYTMGGTFYTGATALRSFLKQHCGTSNVIINKNMMEDATGNTILRVHLDGWTERYDGVLFTFVVTYREIFNA